MSRALGLPAPWGALLAAMVVCSAVAWTGGTDPTQPVKFLLFGLLLAGGLAATVSQWTQKRRVQLTTDPWTWPLWAHLAALLSATVFARAPMIAFVGSPSRFDGLVVYGGLTLLALAAIPTASLRITRLFLLSVVVMVATQAVVAVADAANMLPMLGAGVEGFQGTLGNPNFLGALVGLSTGACLWAALERSHTLWVRVAGVGLLVAGVVLAVLSNAAQGPVTAAVALGFTVLGWVLSWENRAHRVRAMFLLSMASASGAAALAAGFVGLGPLASVADPSSFLLRTYFWRTAMSMGADNPLTGVGLDSYLYAFREYRPLEAVVAEPLAARTDAAHNVVLNLFAGGGWPLLATTLAVVVVTAAGAVRLIKRAAVNDRVLCASLVGVWAGYLMQSLVSIDALPLPIIGWTSTALILGLAHHAESEPTAEVRRRQPSRTMSRSRERSQFVPVLTAAVAAAVVVPFFSAPLRADRLVAQTMQREAAGDIQGAAGDYERAAAIIPWNPEAAYEAGLLHLQLNDAGAARQAMIEAEERAGGLYFPSSLILHRLAVVEGNEAEARSQLLRALSAEPLHPEWLEEARAWADTAEAELLAADLAERLASVEDAR